MTTATAAQFEQLRAAMDAEADQIIATFTAQQQQIAALQQQVADLEAQLAGGLTAAESQIALDGFQGVLDKMESIPA